LNDPQPGAVIAGRIEADHLAEPLKIGALVVMQVREPDAQVSIGTLYILDDDSDVAIVRLQGESPDLWIVDRFSGDGGSRRSRGTSRSYRPATRARRRSSHRRIFSGTGSGTSINRFTSHSKTIGAETAYW
jgi:hypothetical protein